MLSLPQYFNFWFYVKYMKRKEKKTLIFVWTGESGAIYKTVKDTPKLNLIGFLLFQPRPFRFCSINNCLSSPLQHKPLFVLMSSSWCDESLCEAAGLTPLHMGCSGHLGGYELGGENIWMHMHMVFHAPGNEKRAGSKPWAAPLSPAPGKTLVFSSGAHVLHVPRWQVQAGAGRGLTSPMHLGQTKLWLSEQTQMSSTASGGLAANLWCVCLLPRGLSSEGITRQGKRMAENICLLLI